MPKELTLLLTGDVLISTPEVWPPIPHAWRIDRENPDLYSWLEKVAPVLQQGDFTVGNLEGPICEPEIAQRETSFEDVALGLRMPPEVADVLKRAGFTAFTTAGNITMNMGARPMLHSLAHLDRVGLAHGGSGRNVTEARRPAVLERDGVRLALLSYSSVFAPGDEAGENKPGIATVHVSTRYEIGGNIVYNPGVPPRIVTVPSPKDVEAVLDDVRRAKAEADLVVLGWHWGATKYANSYASGLSLEESPFFVLDYQEEMGRAAIDAGADLIMGHHPHRLQGIEVYKGKLICYSLCNLTLTFGEGLNFGEESVIVKAHIDGQTKRFSRYSIVPLMVPSQTMEPYVASGEEATRVVSELERLSKKYGTKFPVENGEIVVKTA